MNEVKGQAGGPPGAHGVHWDQVSGPNIGGGDRGGGGGDARMCVSKSEGNGFFFGFK